MPLNDICIPFLVVFLSGDWAAEAVHRTNQALFILTIWLVPIPAFIYLADISCDISGPT